MIEAIRIIDKHVSILKKLAQRHFIIEKGRIVWSGSSAELTAVPDICGI